MKGPPYTQVVTLEGGQEVPPLSTTATGLATVTIRPDRSVYVTVTVQGMQATASHIHEGATGTNGPVIVPFTKTRSKGEFAIFESAPDAMLTESQYASYKAGKLYINVHSAQYPGGEIRGQLQPV
ncbi:MAG TPA: CHRD domain-containing protein [Casimicrobiaceae bacterium]|nr:CHRD domain-containing protein [Casimicrobiaceae bacterium]